MMLCHGCDKHLGTEEAATKARDAQMLSDGPSGHGPLGNKLK